MAFSFFSPPRTIVHGGGGEFREPPRAVKRQGVMDSRIVPSRALLNPGIVGFTRHWDGVGESPESMDCWSLEG